MRVLKRLLRWLVTLLGPGGGTLDPFRDRPVLGPSGGTLDPFRDRPVLKRTPPKGRSGAVAVAEPDDDN